MQTLWKQKEPLHPAFSKINRCLETDWYLLPFELRIQRGHARALLAAGILTDGEHTGITTALDQIAWNYADTPCPESEAEDVHTWMECMLVHLAGEAGKKIHTARSRNDQVATMMKMYVISCGQRLSEDLERLERTLTERAREWSKLVMPLMTHTQFAAPGSVGAWAMKYAVALARAREHVRFCVGQWKRYCPLGSGAVSGSTIPIDRQVQARELGFEGPSLNSVDSTSTRDECLEILALAGQVGLHLQSLATDVILFAQTSLGWLDYPGAFGTGSSMMPNKTNPDAMELLRGECNAVLSAHTQAVMLLKGLPSGYNRDLQCIKPIVLEAMEKLHELCGLAGAFIEPLNFKPEQLEAALRQGNICATALMEDKVLGGMPLREAHHAVAERLHTMPDEMPDAAAVASRYRTIGCASPAETQRVAQQVC